MALPVISAGTGGDAYSRALARGLAGRGVEATVLEFGYDVEFLPWLRAGAARRQLRGYDIIHCNGDYASLFHADEAPLVITLHHNVFDAAYQRDTSLGQKVYHRGLLRRRIRRAAGEAAAIVFVSHDGEDSFTDLLGNSSAPRQMIYNAVDTDFFVPPAQPRTPTKERCELLFVGSLSRRKGAHLLRPIMQRLGTGFHLTCVSRNGGDLGDSEAITVVEDADSERLLALYQGADMLLFPTQLEGFGYTVVEAMACALPVVSSRCSSIPELYADGEGGRLVTPGDAAGYAVAVSELWANPAQREAMGRANRERAQACFAESNWADAYVDLYQSVLERAA